MIPLQKGATKPSSAGGPEDVFAFLLWLMQKPITKRRKKRLPKDARKFLRMMKALDAARLLQLARANAGIFMSA